VDEAFRICEVGVNAFAVMMPTKIAARENFMLVVQYDGQDFVKIFKFLLVIL